MREIQHSALVAQPPARLFALINDIESYPQFIPWCTHTRVQSRTEREIVATIGVNRGALQGEFTTRNELEPDHRVLMHLVSGPFRMLEGEWLLTAIPPRPQAGHLPIGGAAPGEAPTGGAAPPIEGCKVQLKMKFAFRNPITAVLFERIFAQTASSLVDAFVARARTLGQ
jgi:ribosome-associated toxin RatA of RatAB toxin-antitoxin module